VVDAEFDFSVELSGADRSSTQMAAPIGCSMVRIISFMPPIKEARRATPQATNFARPRLAPAADSHFFLQFHFRTASSALEYCQNTMQALLKFGWPCPIFSLGRRELKRERAMRGMNLQILFVLVSMICVWLYLVYRGKS